MSQDSGGIREGSIAEFMRKRTQLVGFEFGLNKHTQYAIEFVDNSLDAIESFQWKELKKAPENNAFLLKDDMLLENLSYLGGGITDDDIQRIEQQAGAKQIDDEGHEMSEEGEILAVTPSPPVPAEENKIILDQPTKATESKAVTQSEIDDEEALKLRQLQKKEKELEIEVQLIMDSVNMFFDPIRPLVDREPFIIVRVTEGEAPSVYRDVSKDLKDVFQYTFEIFDNGTGMEPQDLEKFGRYLASSKSQKLKQTRGSQGFGSPSAFSDAQNTTGQPITVISKHSKHLFGICSEFYTTSKNNKEYVVPPTEVDTLFTHGTYVKLTYLNVKYKRGYIDDYIRLTALTNPHVNLLYLNPLNEEFVFPRRMSRFPQEPTYAMPHPSSVNIGDFQDLLRSSENITLTAFLQENFVRLSSGLAKTIVSEAEDELQNTLKILNLGDIFVSQCQHPQEPIYTMRYEQRIFGRNKKPRDKLIPYLMDSESDKEKYWEIMTQYNKALQDIEKIQKKALNRERDLNKETDKKAIKEIEKEIKELEKVVVNNQSIIVELHKKLVKTAKEFAFTKEITDEKTTDKMEESVTELLISQARPKSLTQKQTESLFRAFKNQKYMSPPTDTAIPIGSSVLESTMIKEYKLNLSHRTDLFLDSTSELPSLTPSESKEMTHRILVKFNKPEFFQNDSNFKDTKIIPAELSDEKYQDLTNAFDVLHVTDEDFVSAHTRQPTSGKGLAFVVEAVAIISDKIPVPKQPNQALMRYVNRTVKMRDNSDCAIWKAVQSVNWKNYKVDSFDNGIPKGNLVFLVNVAGPYVHLMFKSQSKNALAEDEVLMKEIKFCLEVIGRKIRNFLNKKVRRETNRKRSKTIEKYIPIFINALIGIAKNIPEYKSIKGNSLEQKLFDGLAGKYDHIVKALDAEEQAQEEATEASSEEEEEEIFDEDSEEGVSRPKRIKEEKEIEEKIPEKKTEESKIPISPVIPVVSKVESLKSPPVISKSTEIKIPETKFIETKIETHKSTELKPISGVKPSSSASPTVPVRDLQSIIGTAKKSSTPIPSPSPIKPLEPKSAVQTKPLTPSMSGTSQKTLDVPSKPKLEVTSKPLTGPIKPQATIPPPKPPTSVISQTPAGEPSKLIKPQPKMKLPTNEDILKIFHPNEWINIRDVLSRLEIDDMNIARFVQIKLKQLQSEKRLLVTIQAGKTLWKVS